jgi:polyphosphate kinase
MRVTAKDKFESIIESSDLISRDLSWLKFNERVLDQSKKDSRSIFEKLKFLAITASNLDEFFMIRVGSLYNYLDYDKERIDYSGLREEPFKMRLMLECQQIPQTAAGAFHPEFASQHGQGRFHPKQCPEPGARGTRDDQVIFHEGGVPDAHADGV